MDICPYASRAQQRSSERCGEIHKISAYGGDAVGRRRWSGALKRYEETERDGLRLLLGGTGCPTATGAGRRPGEVGASATAISMPLEASERSRR